MATNPLFSSINKKTITGISNKVYCDSSKKIVAELTSRCMISQKRNTMAADGQGGPPEKRRKTETTEMADDLWGDDDDGDFILSQMQLENIGSPMQQAPQQQHKGGSRKEPNNNSTGGRFSNNKTSRPEVTSSIPQNSGDFSSMHSTKSQGYHTMPAQPSGPNALGHQASGSSEFNKRDSQRSKPMPSSSASNKPSISGSTFQGKNSSLSNNKMYPPVSKRGLDIGKQSPTAGTTASTPFGESMQKKITQTEEENNYLKSENQKLKESQYGKDGQIRVLRTKVAQLEAERSREKHEKMLQKEQQNKEQSEKEKRLERDLEKAKSSLQFKDRELQDMHERCRRIERQGKSSSVETSPGRIPPRSPCRSNTTFQSPSRGKIGLQSPKSSSSSGGVKNELAPPTTPVRTGREFPTRKSFLEQEVSPKVKRTEVNVIVKKEKDDTSTARPSAKPKKKAKMRIPIEKEKGNLTGPQVVSKLLDDSDGQSSAMSSTSHGIIDLFHNSLPVVDVSHMKIERDKMTMNLSPVATLRTNRHSVESEVSTSSSSEASDRYSVRGENLKHSQHAMTSLLNSRGWTTTNPALDGGSGVNQHSSLHAIHILPMIENYLQIYIDIMQGLNDSITSTSSQSLDRGQSVDSSVDSLTTSLRSYMVKGTSYFNKIESQTLSALSILDKLIEYCAYVRLVLAADKEDFDALKHGNKAEVRNPEERLEQNNIKNKDPVEGCSRLHNSSPVGNTVLLDLDSATLKTAKHCDILVKLIKLANPLEFHNKLGNLNICQAALRLLTEIAKYCTLQQLKKFTILFSQESLLNCLKELDLQVEHQMSLATCTLQLLTVLVRSPVILEQLCLQDEECILQHVYTNCEVVAGKAHQSRRMVLSQKLFEFIYEILTTHQNGPALLFETDCDCTSQVVKCVTSTVYRELETYDDNKSAEVLAFLRKGLCLLHHVCTNDRLFTRHHEKFCKYQFIHTICGMDKLFKVLPDTDDAELSLVYELWDFDQEVDTDEDLHQDGDISMNHTQGEVMLIE